MSSNIPRVGFGIMILNENNEVLLGLRHNDPKKADSELHGEGSWTMPGGKLEFQESLIEGAKREVEEECGLIVKSLEFISVSSDMAPDAHFVTIGFLCREFEGEPEAREPNEIIEWQWYDADGVPGSTFPPSRKILDNYLHKTHFSEE